jgi:hypothetical protein
MTEDALMRKGIAMLQSCTVVPASTVTIIKVEEVPEPISFSAINAEPDEVSYLPVPIIRHVTNIHKCVVSHISISTSVQLNNSIMLSGNFILFLACVNL